MWNRFFEPTDIEDRNQLRSLDAAQLILTGVFFVGAIDLQRYDHLACNDNARTWISVMLYGNLFWLFYLGTTLVGRYRSKVIRFFFKVLNYIFYLFHIVMFIWNYMLWTSPKQYLGSFYTNCYDAANYYADCYRYLGYFFAVVLAVGIFATLCSLFRPKENLDQSVHFDNTGRTQGVNPNDPFGKGVAGQYGANTYQPIPLVANTGAVKPNIPFRFSLKK